MKAFLLFISLIIILLVGLVFLVGLPDFNEREMSDAYDGEYIEIKGEKIRYYQKGKGPDILLIHGMREVAEDWESLVPELGKEYRVTLFDRPGQGFSSFTYVPDPLRYNVEIVTGLIEALSLKDVIIAGHDYGGAIALALAVRDLPQVKGYVLLSPSSFPAIGVSLVLHAIAFPYSGKGIIRTIKGFILPTTIKSNIELAFNPDRDFMPEDYIKNRIPLLFQTKGIISAAREELYFNKEIKSINEYYGAITKPVLIIHGEYDKVVSPLMSQDLNAQIPGSKLVVFKEAGHMLQYVYPEEIKKAIDTFEIPPEIPEAESL